MFVDPFRRKADSAANRAHFGTVRNVHGNHSPQVWKGGADVSQLAGKPVRLRFQFRNADLYSYQFKVK